MAARPDPARRPTAGRILLLGAMTAFGAMSIDLYLPGLPVIAHDLGASAERVGLTVATYVAGQAVGQLFWGPLSDRRGRRGPLFAGIALYVGASVACALAGSMLLLLLARFAQGLGGCAAMVIARAIVRDEHDEAGTARTLSWLTLVMGMAPILAPSLGALVLDAAGWRAMFWLLAGFGALVFAAAFLALPETRAAPERAAASAATPFATYWRLLGHRRLLGYLMTGGFASAGLFAYIAASPALFIEGFGLSPAHYAWVFGANGIAFVLAAQVNRRLLAIWSPDRVLSITLPLTAAVAALFALLALAGLASLWVTVVALFALLAGFGFQVPNTAAGAMSVDPRHSGSIAALQGAASFGIGAGAAALASALSDGTPRPLALVTLVAFGLSAFGFFALAQRR
jgi:DHA1 family bicyclomycin/chloramphenicol resistance-like MFS transporter